MLYQARDLDRLLRGLKLWNLWYLALSCWMFKIWAWYLSLFWKSAIPRKFDWKDFLPLSNHLLLPNPRDPPHLLNLYRFRSSYLVSFLSEKADARLLFHYLLLLLSKVNTNSNLYMDSMLNLDHHLSLLLQQFFVQEYKKMGFHIICTGISIGQVWQHFFKHRLRYFFVYFK